MQLIFLFLSILFHTALFSNPEESHYPKAVQVNKHQIIYLMQLGEVEKAISLYQQYQSALGKHDFEILQTISFILLEKGSKSENQVQQMLSLYGAHLASIASSLDILQEAVTSSFVEIQVAAIKLLGIFQDDRSDELLLKAMSSSYFITRVEAAFQLSLRKHPASAGQIEALMHRVPEQFKSFFPQFFALIGTDDAISILKHLIDDPNPQVRVQAILNTANYNRDDLLPLIRSASSHSNIAEQEAAAIVLGKLKDLSSMNRLKRLKNSSSSNVQLAAATSLFHLGDRSAKDLIIEKARGGDLYAISILAEIGEGGEPLSELMRSDNLNIRFNSAMALLKQRDEKAVEVLLDLSHYSRDMGFYFTKSLGDTLSIYKVVPSKRQHAANFPFNIEASTYIVKETILREALELKPQTFLAIARTIFDRKELTLIPLAFSMIRSLAERSPR